MKDCFVGWMSKISVFDVDLFPLFYPALLLFLTLFLWVVIGKYIAVVAILGNVSFGC